MPWNSAASTVHNIKDSARKWQPLGTHHCIYCRYSPFKGKLNLSLMLIFRCKRHCEYVSFKEVATKTSNTTSNIQQHSTMLTPCYIWNSLQPNIFGKITRSSGGAVSKLTGENQLCARTEWDVQDKT